MFQIFTSILHRVIIRINLIFVREVIEKNVAPATNIIIPKS